MFSELEVPTSVYGTYLPVYNFVLISDLYLLQGMATLSRKKSSEKCLVGPKKKMWSHNYVHTTLWLLWLLCLKIFPHQSENQRSKLLPISDPKTHKGKAKKYVSMMTKNNILSTGRVSGTRSLFCLEGRPRPSST